METPNKKINSLTLVSLVVTTSIGSGIFALSSDLAKAASPGPALISWFIVGCGILLLATTLNNLLHERPDLQGIFSYGQSGFGPFTGFISGWGYWMSCWLGNVAFSTVFMSTLGYFFPVFLKNNSLISIIIASLCSWFLTWLVNRGVENAAFINSIITLCKLIPIFTFIIVSIFAFKSGIFTQDFWGNLHNSVGDGSILKQIKNCFMVMMWVFVGIEGASVLSARASSQKAAGRATIIGVLCLLLIYICASILPYGHFTRVQLINAKQPAMVYLFKELVGSWGGTFISIGLLISIFGAWISWTMLPAETLSEMAKKQLLPAKIGQLNKHKAPTFALVITGVMVQIFLITLLFSQEAYELAYSLCTAAVVISYIIVAAFQIKQAKQQGNRLQLAIGWGTLLFELVGITLAGLQYLLVCTIIYLPGIYLYYLARRQLSAPLFSKREKWGVICLIFLGVLALILVLAQIIKI
ncbi:arginine-ornithine antiporter [Bombilactobacillus thymidiniphilus]|uniref:Arginine-ornithine antiporter n=1 Tax=Bombilactobacillus thymidiniphilus TaxID=2923363 RepID=A0ABY4PBQ3_9LACO|nr:arginine-ornithine antiporter [Bombilactobacillus thymidiniphilus]UQS83179.1 arginine-ornithine antiporter [Bombilactobacillus thymidiniphilus]